MIEKQDYLKLCEEAYNNKLTWQMEKYTNNINTFKEFKTFCYNKIRESYNFVYKLEETEDSIKIYYEEPNEETPFIPDIEFIVSNIWGGFNLFVFGITWYNAIDGLHTFDK